MSVEIPFFSQTAVLDQYIHSANPVENEEVLSIIIGVLRTNPELRKWFFNHRPHPRWAEILLDSGFLDEAPSPIETHNGNRVNMWDAQEYLISVASQVPGVVLEHFERLKGHPFYFERAIYALRQIPMSDANKAMPTLLRKLADVAFVRMAGKEAFELMTAMAKEDLTEAAFDLFGTLTVPQPSANVREYKSLSGVFFDAEAVSLLPTKEYEQGKFWRPAVKELSRLDLERLVAELERLLLLTLRMEAETGNRGEEFERSSFWRNAIEETGQDHGEDYKDLLLELLRDNLDLLPVRKPAAAKQIVDRYLSHSIEILRRLGLYLLWRFPAQFRVQVNKALFDPENIDHVGIHHEYFMLLQHGYPQLVLADREKLEQIILAGPGTEKLKEVADWADKEMGEDPEAYAQGYRKHWIQKRLWMIREHVAGEASAELQRLINELGEPDHPAFTHWSSGARWISSVSPNSVDELSGMTPESLIKYLRNWKSSATDYSRSTEHSIWELSGTVAEAVLSDLDKYGDLILEIAQLSPIYATTLITHSFTEVVDVEAVQKVRLSLIERLLADETICRDVNRSDGAGWVGFRSATVDYVRKLMERGDWQVSPDELPRLRDILILLVDDPDHDPKSDQPQVETIGHDDLATTAINHVRPKALGALVNYARYVALQGEDGRQKCFGPKRLEPLIEQTLTRKVDWRNDPSLSVHFIVGQNLNLLCWLDLEWVREHIDDILPEGDDESSNAFFAAAWRAFVLYNHEIYAEIFNLLRDKYVRAIGHVKNGHLVMTGFDPVESFASHLMVEYLFADYELHPADGQQSLIVRFFNETPAEVRRQAAWGIVSTYRNCKKDELQAAKHWQRTRALWQWRLDEAARMGFSSDFEGEMEGFNGLLDVLPEQENIASMWPLLQGALHYVEGIDHHDPLWRHLEEYLSREVRRDPVRAIQLFRLMHDRLQHALSFYFDTARAILEVGVERKESRGETLLLLEQLARWGCYEFNSLYEKYAALNSEE